MALGGVGLRDQHAEVGARPIGDERLRAVDDVLVAVADRGRADAGNVGAGAGLGDAEAPDLLALDPGHQVALLLLLGAEEVDRRQDHVGLHGEGHVGAARARVAHALGADQRVVVVAALAAVLLREAEAEVAQLAGALHDLGGPVGVLPLVAVGVELLLDPRLHRLAQVEVLLREEEVLARGLVLGLQHVAAVGRGRCGHSYASSGREWRRPHDACMKCRVILSTYGVRKDHLRGRRQRRRDDRARRSGDAQLALAGAARRSAAGAGGRRRTTTPSAASC